MPSNLDRQMSSTRSTLCCCSKLLASLLASLHSQRQNLSSCPPFIQISLKQSTCSTARCLGGGYSVLPLFFLSADCKDLPFGFLFRLIFKTMLDISMSLQISWVTVSPPFFPGCDLFTFACYLICEMALLFRKNVI